ncbi:phosphate ABC transporter substrate-binding protein [Methylomonas methanica]|uniref:Phosphate binding protein n=1 Tax=Methylomonas methanica (strain DSM 25384 / MC09) TaxID=857087 RepID=F9ZVS1_METMM|nr:phosphate ABC transporter substrate-binding protein [Methylomonas methanica]AEF99549.1 phosphate binding protein [Methylomonas methanica MC09]
MKKAIGAVVLLSLILAAAYFTNLLNLPGTETAEAAASHAEKLVLTGSSTVAPLAAEIGKRFESQHPNVRIDVQTGGSSRGVNDARSDLADIGMASRALKPEEAELKSYTIALDGISIIVNATNPVTALDKQQIIDVFTGKITNWNALGGNDAPITVVNKAEGRSTLELFLHYFGLNNTDIKAQVVIGDNQQGIKTVAGNPDAIGYVSVGAAEYEAGHAVAIKLLPLDGIAASVENVRNGSFPLSRPLNLVTKTEPSGVAKAFIDFASSYDVNDLIEAQYFVPVAH